MKQMNKQEHMTSFQFIILLFLFIIGDEVAILPSIQAVDAKQDGWLVGLISLIIGVCIVLFIYYPLSRLYPRKTFAEYSEEILGKWLGKLLVFLFVLYSFYYAALSLRYTGDFTTSQILPRTPTMVIYILFAIIVVMGVSLGIETLARSFELFYIPLILVLLVITFCLIPVSDIRNLQPMLEDGFRTILRGSITFVSLPYVELIFFLMVVPFVHPQEKVKKSWVIGTILGGLFITSFALMTILVLGVNITSETLYPGWKMGKRISLGEFFQKIEITINMIAYFDLYCRIAFCFYCAHAGLMQLFKIKNSRALALPLGILLVLVTQLVVSDTSYLFYLNRYKPFLDFFCALLPALLLLIVGTIKKKMRKHKST
jgi:spore germination protein KB